MWAENAKKDPRKILSSELSRNPTSFKDHEVTGQLTTDLPFYHLHFMDKITEAQKRWTFLDLEDWGAEIKNQRLSHCVKLP